MFMMLMYFMSLLMFSMMYPHLLMTLMSLEIMMLSLMSYMYMYMLMLNLEYFLLYFMLIVVCEGVLGLSLLILFIRFKGMDNLNLISLSLW
uniref:NADH dehydrogenase subunit 4L n=1 Tax=Dryocosmus liui TaxID=2315263 RepID=UPI002264D9D1|nr:NADH dehydrogenase subunit 4L [Dryocosmus liui]UEE83322.1 NADH dehydrogenase subunit 4L [Dryocosmus liui]